MQTTCNNCGYINEDNAKFCLACGQPLNQEEKVVINKNKGKNKRLFIIVGIVIAIVVFSILGIVMLTKASKDVEQEYAIYEEEAVDIWEETDIEEEVEYTEELDTEVVKTIDYNEISEMYCGAVAPETHYLGAVNEHVRYCTDKEVGFHDAGFLQAYDGNPETLFIHFGLMGSYYAYSDIESRNGNILTLYNPRIDSTAIMEYIGEYEFKFTENGKECYYILENLVTPIEQQYLSLEEVEAEVLTIREWYNMTQDNIADAVNEMIWADDDGTVGYDGNDFAAIPTKVFVPAGVNGIDYTREYYYTDESRTTLYFIFAYNNQGEEHRIYMDPNEFRTIRYIYNDQIYNSGDEIPQQMEWLRNYFYNEGHYYIPI